MTSLMKTIGAVAGLVLGLALSTVLLATAPQVLKGCVSDIDTVETVRIDTITVNLPAFSETVYDTIHASIPDSVIDRLYATVKDSALAEALRMITQTVGVTHDFRVDADSVHTVIGKVRIDYCACNGLLSSMVSIDSLITPAHILEIAKTYSTTTGIDWYWLPASVLVGLLLGIWLF